MSRFIWKDIKGFEGLFQISCRGEVKRLARTVTVEGSVRNKSYIRNYKEKILKQGNDKDGYKLICLRFDNCSKTKSVHRLVAEAFIPNPDNLPQVNHKNGIKWDNRVENLEWCTQSINTQHAYDNNLINVAKGEKCRHSKLKDNDIIDICQLLNSGMSHGDIAKVYKVSRTAITHISLGKTWTHITGYIAKEVLK